MKNSNFVGLGIIVAAAVLWAGHSMKSEIRGQLVRDRSVTGEEKFSSPPVTSLIDVAARGPIGQKNFDIRSFEDLEKSDTKESKSVHRSLREMQRLLKCFESENCNFDQSTATSYRTAVRDSLMDEMQMLQNMVQLDAYNDPSLMERASDVTRFFLQFPDDDIKDQAISLAASLPIANATCESLIAGLSESSSAPLFEKGISELKRYIGTSEKQKIDELLIQSMISGSTFVSKLVARESLPFISNENTPRFLEVLNQLPRRSKEFEMLKANVDEYQRM